MAERIADQVTAMVITYNEAANIERCLESLKWAPRVLLVDSGSTDATLAIAARYPQVVVVTRAFDDFASQCNFGLSQIQSRWVLSLDSDYELSAELIGEITSLRETDAVGYSCAFTYCIYGRPLRSSLYPPRTVLYRTGLARYGNEGHGHRVMVEGRVGQLVGRMSHDDRKPLARWLASQQSYARREADHLLSAPRAALGKADRLRLLGWPAPVLAFFFTLLWKRCLLDGWPGWLYTLQRTLAEMMLALELVDRRLRGSNSPPVAPDRGKTHDTTTVLLQGKCGKTP